MAVLIVLMVLMVLAVLVVLGYTARPNGGALRRMGEFSQFPSEVPVTFALPFLLKLTFALLVQLLLLLM